MVGRSLLIICCMLLLVACKKEMSKTRTVNAPIYMTLQQLRSDAIIQTTPVEVLDNTGKIYFKDNYIFINDKNEGVHIIDNSDPSNPINTSYIAIPGNTDISIKGDKLFANSCMDLVVIDISDLDNVNEIGRLNDAFPYFAPEPGSELITYGVDANKGIIVGWQEQTITEQELSDYYGKDAVRGDDGIIYEVEVAVATDESGGVSNSGTGTGGSMAAFKLNGNYLYTIHQNSSIKVFDISDATAPVVGEDIYVTWGIETLFLKDEYLFIGAQDGMYIYGLQDSSKPSYISQFTHMRSCDPVVVQDGYAYVTLRGGSACGGNENQLDVINISNIYDPELVKSHSMYNPHGLGIDSNLLFICDGNEGLKVYDVTDPLTIDSNQVSHFSGINAFDVIPLNGNLLMIGEDGLHQYDYANADSIVLLSILTL